MATVTFACVCVDAHVGARIDTETNGRAADLVFEQSGKQALELPAGRYALAYRAQGTPGTPFSLKATAGGTMPAIERTLPDDGAAAGVRTLIVRAAVLLAALSSFHGKAYAQPAPVERAAAVSPRAAAERALSTLPNVSDVLTPGYYLSFEASSDSKTGIGTIAVQNASGAFTAAFSLQAPLSDTTHDARPLTLDGLNGSAAVGASLHWFFWSGGPDVEAMRSVCERALGRSDCDDDELTGAERRQFLRLAHAGGSPTTVNSGVTFGRRSFRYADSETLAGTSQTHDQVAASLGVGHYTPRLGYVAASYRFERTFSQGDSEQLCTLRDAATVLECRTSVVGAPSKHTRQSAEAEWRWFVRGGRLAINPSVSRDFRGRVSALDVPFYFLQLAAGGLAGGARAGWRSDRPGVAVAIFIGAALRATD